MASTTTTKKEIVDFLWEWAENQGEWAKLMTDQIIRSETNLTVAESNNVFDYFLQSIGLLTGLPALNITKPIYVPTNKIIELSTLSSVTGVNRLCSNQSLTFCKNITIVYGENGTGKTGYGRILKNLGFSYDTNDTIHNNIYNTTVNPQSAIIGFSANGNSQTFNWNGTNKNLELQNISVFNNNCVSLSLADRNLIVSPIGFHLFNIITTELGILSTQLNQKIATYPTDLPWLPITNIGTPQNSYLTSLTRNSTEQDLSTLSTLVNNHDALQKEKEDELSGLNRQVLQNEIQSLLLIDDELTTIIAKIQSAKSLLTNENWQLLLSYNKTISDLESKTSKGIKEIADTNGIKFYETIQFQKFIQSAEDYIKLLNKPEYPTEDENCIYCKQPLESSAADLLKSYRTLLNDKTQENLEQSKKAKTVLINSITSIEINLNVNQPTFGINPEGKAVQPAELIEYNQLLASFKNIFINGQVLEGSIFQFDYDKYLSFLTTKKMANIRISNSKSASLNNLATRENELRMQIAELKDRKLLSTKVQEVKTIISNKGIISLLQAHSNSFGTNSISRKNTEAREELIRQNFEQQFLNELKAFRKSDLKIELSFGTDRAKPRISHRMKTHFILSDILSEGEQKAIALAEFLTELQLDNIKAPVIFDDPVNSLDHRIIDEVCKRLIQLSNERQVIIFTHSILLLNSLIQQSELDTNKQANIHFKFHKVKSNFGITGILDEVEEINSFSYYTKKLQTVIDTKPNGQDEAKLAAEGYGHLRSAIEVCVEDDILKKIIKRYKKGVAFPSLLRINGIKLDTHKGKLNDIYEKCCVSIDGHSSPSEVHTTPTIEELKADYLEFKVLRANFN